MRNRRGVTVIELMVALSLAGIVLLTAHGLLGVLGDSRTMIARDALAQDDAGTGFRRLRDALLMRQVPEAATRPFFGDATGAEFDSRCQRAGGWLEPCRVEIQLKAHAESTVVELREDAGPWSAAARFDSSWHLAYQERRTDGRSWRARWGTSIARPSAVALVHGPDTLVLAGDPR